VTIIFEKKFREMLRRGKMGETGWGKRERHIYIPKLTTPLSSLK
jgi:hypothetical protein